MQYTMYMQASKCIYAVAYMHVRTLFEDLILTRFTGRSSFSFSGDVIASGSIHLMIHHLKLTIETLIMSLVWIHLP